MRFPAGWCQLSWTRHGFLVGGGQGIVTHFPSQDDTEAAVKVAQEGSNPWRLQSSNTISCLEMFFPHWNCLLCLLLFVERIVYYVYGPFMDAHCICTLGTMLIAH